MDADPRQVRTWEIAKVLMFAGVVVGAIEMPPSATNEHVQEMAQMVARRGGHLQSLSLAGCTEITDDALAHVAGLDQLVSLDLTDCWQITDQGLQHLAGMRNLRVLLLDGCSGITALGLSYLPVLGA